ncbi:inhibitor of cysteine protease 2 [Cystoisospora suis]|uniref:Inhibitor of cysteine protease 2 n=1 Tax=Cystoisospora suis TaxID=483139 RepID=A0A2C6LAI5_9APIC|nr:inhibitor of cysteine protease 2 [Cystoisospora suis]
MGGSSGQRLCWGAFAVVFVVIAAGPCQVTTSEAGDKSDTAVAPVSGTCAGSRTLSFFPPERIKEEDGKKSTGVDVRYSRARGLVGSENALKVEIPAIRGTGYVLVLLDIYPGLDIPEDLRNEIRTRLGGPRVQEDAEDGKTDEKDSKKKEEEKSVLFQKILREPTRKFGLTATAPEGIRVPATKKGVGSQHLYVSELTAEKAGDFTVAYASVRPWNINDDPQVYFALVHFD